MINLIRRTCFNLYYNVWDIRQVWSNILSKLNVFSNYFQKKSYSYNHRFIEKWQIKERGNFNFNGAILPDITKNTEMTAVLKECFMDTFVISCYFGDNYDKKIVEYVDKHTREGAYGYTDSITGFDVTIKDNSVVIDAGAWIGDFAAYAASKGATVYAFEPSPSILPILHETSSLNNHKIIPVPKGLGSKEEEKYFRDTGGSAFGNRFVDTESADTTMLSVTTIDAFVKENGILNIDFIKADIEGAERDMLYGARETLKYHAPKLAICTYHRADDPEILEKIIRDANPNYTIVQKRHKLYACVIKKSH